MCRSLAGASWQTSNALSNAWNGVYWTQGFRQSQVLFADARHAKLCKYICKSILHLPTALSGTWSGRSQCLVPVS